MLHYFFSGVRYELGNSKTVKFYKGMWHPRLIIFVISIFLSNCSCPPQNNSRNLPFLPPFSSLRRPSPHSVLSSKNLRTSPHLITFLFVSSIHRKRAPLYIPRTHASGCPPLATAASRVAFLRGERLPSYSFMSLKVTIRQRFPDCGARTPEGVWDDCWGCPRKQSVTADL